MYALFCFENENDIAFTINAAHIKREMRHLSNTSLHQTKLNVNFAFSFCSYLEDLQTTLTYGFEQTDT